MFYNVLLIFFESVNLIGNPWPKTTDLSGKTMKTYAVFSINFSNYLVICSQQQSKAKPIVFKNWIFPS